MLLEKVTSVLDRAEIPYAVIGASALTVYGVSRATFDLDLLVTDMACLQPAFWASLEGEDTELEVRRGNMEDPLAGVVRFNSQGDRPVDLIVGKYTWQREIVQRARPVRLGSDVEMPVIRAADLILLKLFAGGPQDAWDIQQLLLAEERAELVAEVEQGLSKLPSSASSLWTSLLQS